MILDFWKTQTIGNDFVLVHASPDLPDLATLARRLCSRHFSIGSDGLLVVGRDLRLQMFNPDGSGDFCGNGLRCAGKHAFDQGWGTESFSLVHGGISVPTWVNDQGVTCETPAASFDPSIVPLRSTQDFIDQECHGVVGTAVSTGSAHFVAFVDELPPDELFYHVSPLIENDPLFPERISVMWIKVNSQTELELRIWERGAGETLGCGTGSMAAAVVWARKNATSGQIIVRNPGGDLVVSMDSWDRPVRTTSQPTVAYQGQVTV